MRFFVHEDCSTGGPCQEVEANSGDIIYTRGGDEEQGSLAEGQEGVTQRVCAWCLACLTGPIMTLSTALCTRRDARLCMQKVTQEIEFPPRLLVPVELIVNTMTRLQRHQESQQGRN